VPRTILSPAERVLRTEKDKVPKVRIRRCEEGNVFILLLIRLREGRFTVFSVKRFLGRRLRRFLLLNRWFSPVQMSMTTDEKS
jgi:hypothetical protein